MHSKLLAPALIGLLSAACGEDAAMMMPGTGTTAAQLLEDCQGTFDVSDVDSAASFRADGRRIIIRGVYQDGTTAQLLALLDQNPDVRTLVLANVGGSDVSMEGNLVGGREVRRRGLATCVPAGGLVASGGTDFLLSGGQRAVLAGGRVGVHAWAGGDEMNPIVATDFPRDSEEHRSFLDYYRDIGISDEFYWFTLQAAPPEGMYFMTREEMTRFVVFTTE